VKKVILGLIVGLIVGMPISASAWHKFQGAKPIMGVDCNWNYDYGNSDGKQDGSGYRCSGTIYVFDDADNKCYIVKGSNASGISCVKK
jgi:hypothetical protein